MSSIPKNELEILYKTETQAEIARIYGVSREYVRQLINKHGLKKKYRVLHIKKNRCLKCDKYFENTKDHKVMCPECKKNDHRYKTICDNCGGELRRKKGSAKGLCSKCRSKLLIYKVSPEKLKLGKILLQYRKKKKLSQKDVAKRLGLSISRISHFECGRSLIPEKCLEKLGLM